MSFLVTLMAIVLADSSKDIVGHVQEALLHETTVSFYFVTRTEGRFTGSGQLKSASSISINRSCGRNCRAFMADVVMHLEESSPTKCSGGRENLLIEFGDINLIYRESGRIVEVNGVCFFNEKSVIDIVRKDEFLFN